MKSEKEISEQIHAIARKYSTTRHKPNVAILQPRRNIKETPAQQLQNWQDRHIMIGSAASYHAIDGNPVDVARNYLIEQALEDDVKYILFIDEDTVLPYDAFVKLEKTSRLYPDAIIVGIYYFKFGEVMMSILDEDGHWILPDVTPNTGLIHNLITAGMGCSLIPLKLIKRVKEKFPEIPLFCIVPEKTWGDNEVSFMGEDTWFYNLAQQCGIEMIADTSVHCLHMELKTGKYTAHPDVNLNEYKTNIPITVPLTLMDKARVDQDYADRICRVYNIPDLENKTLKEIYELRCSDKGHPINEHLSILKDYAKECDHITEMGTEYGYSLFALMSGKPKKMVSYDLIDLKEYGLDLDQLKKLASDNGVDYNFIQGDSRGVEIENTDLLFIDTYHTYDCLKTELTQHGNKAAKYIIMHDNTTFGDIGADGGEGLWKAVEEFLAENENWKLHKRFTNNNGLAILKKVIL